MEFPDLPLIFSKIYRIPGFLRDHVTLFRLFLLMPFVLSNTQDRWSIVI